MFQHHDRGTQLTLTEALEVLEHFIEGNTRRVIPDPETWEPHNYNSNGTHYSAASCHGCQQAIALNIARMDKGREALSVVATLVPASVQAVLHAADLWYNVGTQHTDPLISAMARWEKDGRPGVKKNV